MQHTTKVATKCYVVVADVNFYSLKISTLFIVYSYFNKYDNYNDPYFNKYGNCNYPHFEDVIIAKGVLHPSR